MPDPVLLASLAGGLLLMAVSGELLVRGALGIGNALSLSPFAAGIFIIGLGTSAPEIFLSVQAAWSGSPGLATGNIVGSNIANILLVAAVPALLFPYRSEGSGQWFALAALVLVTGLWILTTALLPLGPAVGLCFLLMLAGYCGLSFDIWRLDPAQAYPGQPAVLWRALLYAPLGIAGLLVASGLIIASGSDVARALQVPEEWIGLTLLALGTSLPEIGAGLAAAARGRGDLVMGNVLGSCLFNILAAGGIVAFAGPLEVAGLIQTYDHWVLGFSVLLLTGLLAMRARFTRLLGLLLMLIYASYIYGLVNGVNLQAAAGLLAG